MSSCIKQCRRPPCKCPQACKHTLSRQNSSMRRMDAWCSACPPPCQARQSDLLACSKVLQGASPEAGPLQGKAVEAVIGSGVIVHHVLLCLVICVWPPHLRVLDASGNRLVATCRRRATHHRLRLLCSRRIWARLGLISMCSHLHKHRAGAVVTGPRVAALEHRSKIGPWVSSCSLAFSWFLPNNNRQLLRLRW